MHTLARRARMHLYRNVSHSHAQERTHYATQMSIHLHKPTRSPTLSATHLPKYACGVAGAAEGREHGVLVEKAGRVEAGASLGTVRAQVVVVPSGKPGRGRADGTEAC